MLEKGDAPSYFIEGLLYNAPNTVFGGSKSDMVLEILKWLHGANDLSKFVCANERYYLTFDGSPVCWPKANSQKFIREAIKLWNEWP